MTDNKKILRRQLRERRRQLSKEQQAAAAIDLWQQFSGSPFIYSTRRVAAYIAADGEIDPGVIIANLNRRGILCTLPCLDPIGVNRLRFAPYGNRTILVDNRMRIPEPKSGPRLKAFSLDLVLLPLVGFDLSGNRLGMGGGFYDRTFAFKRRSRTYGPKMVGLAHECQRVDELITENWDVPLDAIVTDERVLVLR